MAAFQDDQGLNIFTMFLVNLRSFLDHQVAVVPEGSQFSFVDMDISLFRREGGHEGAFAFFFAGKTVRGSRRLCEWPRNLTRFLLVLPLGAHERASLAANRLEKCSRMVSIGMSVPLSGVPPYWLVT